MTGKALNNAEDILDEPLGDPADENGAFESKLRAKTSTIKTILTTQSKVDETRLRRQQFDRLPELLKAVNDVASRLPGAVRQAPTIDHVPG